MEHMGITHFLALGRFVATKESEALLRGRKAKMHHLDFGFRIYTWRVGGLSKFSYSVRIVSLLM